MSVTLRRARRGRVSVLAAALTVLALSVSACSSGTSTTPAGETVQIDVGTDTPVSAATPLRVAVALPGTNNSYLQAQIEQVKSDIAKIPGAEVTIFDGKFDPTTQFNSLQTIIESGKYNAILLPSLDSNLNCKVATEQAPAKNIVVVAMTTALCGRTVNEGEELWAPGTLSYVGGLDTVDYWTDYLEYVIAKNPGPQKVVVLKGPDNIGITINLDAAIEKVTAEHPEFEIVAQANTDYSIPQGNEKATDMLQAHPDASIIFSAYVTLTQGAVQAVQAAGRTGDIKIYDKGSSKYSIEQLEAGTIEASAPEYPRTTISSALQQVVDAFDGKAPVRFLKNSGAPLPADAEEGTGFFVITKDTASSFTPES
ncbi:sugar ABC transporter substrate-binding protein [Microbacterium sp. NPDC086615]|uniref:sugar ABC transporter substrate-binding protein n=1 Tax=Microbacterium sp. NPDC086615 TaxID=3154865 RepID=UPI003434EB9A|nr:hypothetical protein [Microbacterium sp.]